MIHLSAKTSEWLIMTKRFAIMLTAITLTLTGCGLGVRPTPAPIFVTATPIPVLETPTSEVTDVLGATPVDTEQAAVLPTFPTATSTPTSTRKPTLTPSFTPTSTDTPTPKGTKSKLTSPGSCATPPQA